MDQPSQQSIYPLNFQPPPYNPSFIDYNVPEHVGNIGSIYEFIMVKRIIPSNQQGEFVATSRFDIYDAQYNTTESISVLRDLRGQYALASITVYSRTGTLCDFGRVKSHRFELRDNVTGRMLQRCTRLSKTKFNLTSIKNPTIESGTLSNESGGCCCCGASSIRALFGPPTQSNNRVQDSIKKQSVSVRMSVCQGSRIFPTCAASGCCGCCCSCGCCNKHSLLNISSNVFDGRNGKLISTIGTEGKLVSSLASILLGQHTYKIDTPQSIINRIGKAMKHKPRTIEMNNIGLLEGNNNNNNNENLSTNQQTANAEDILNFAESADSSFDSSLKTEEELLNIRCSILMSVAILDVEEMSSLSNGCGLPEWIRNGLFKLGLGGDDTE